MNNEEQIKILQMVADGKITVEEGEKLLEAVEMAVQAEAQPSDVDQPDFEDAEFGFKQSKLDKKREKEYKKHLKRVQKAEEKSKYYGSRSTRVSEDRLTRAVDELAQNAVDKAFASIGKKVEDLSDSIFG
jgi:DUF4097 and DUF4098 domain-containing protein YvlB